METNQNVKRVAGHLVRDREGRKRSRPLPQPSRHTDPHVFPRYRAASPQRHDRPAPSTHRADPKAAGNWGSRLCLHIAHVQRKERFLIVL